MRARERVRETRPVVTTANLNVNAPRRNKERSGKSLAFGYQKDDGAIVFLLVCAKGKSEQRGRRKVKTETEGENWDG